MSTIKCLGFLVAIAMVSAFATDSFAQLAKQGKFDVIGTFEGTVIETQKFGEHVINVVKVTLINLNKSGSGFLHNTSSLCMLVTIPGSFHGYCTTTDLEGDQIYHHNFIDKGFALGTGGGGRKMVIDGGTGKYKGIQGEAPYEVIYAPKLEGKLIGHFVMSGEYRIQ